MSKAEFQLSYDGPALTDGSMDVNELAFSLMAVGDLLREANRELNADRAEVSVRVKSDFKKGSFDVAMLVDQSLLEHASKLLFPGMATIGGLALLRLLFGADVEKAGVIPSLLEVWKKLKGEKPKETIEDKAKGTTIIVMGDGNKVNAEPIVAELYGKDMLRMSISGMVRPLSNQGIDSLTLRRGKKNLNIVDKSDLPLPHECDSLDASTGLVSTSTREAMLRVGRANFENGKWGFSDGAAHFSAAITDKEFMQKLDAHDVGFYKGDTLRAILSVTQIVSPDGNKFHTKYEIERVLDHVHEPKQQNLLPPGSSTK